MNDRAIGRAGFLGILGAGAVGLFLARDFTGLLDRAVPKSVSAIVPTSGWRIYTVGSSMPNIAPAAYRLRGRRPRCCAEDLHARRPQGDAAGRAGLRLPLRHGLGRQERALGRRPDRRRARAGRSQAGRLVAPLRLGRGALRGLADAQAGAAARRDARLRDGRQAALPSARRPRPARDAARCTATRASSGSTGSSSGRRCRPATGSRTATTSMRGSVGRMATEPAPVPATRADTASSASPAPSGCSTGPTRRRSSRSSRPG